MTKVSDKQLEKALTSLPESKRQKAKNSNRPLDSYELDDLKSMARNPIFDNDRRMACIEAYKEMLAKKKG